MILPDPLLADPDSAPSVFFRRFQGVWTRACLLACLQAGLLRAQAPVITLACEDKMDFPNVLGNSLEVDWKKPGVSVEFIKQMAEELGLKVVIKRLPWKRALELELKGGKIDGLFPVSYLKEREGFGVLPMKDGKADDSRSMLVSAYCFYKLKTSPLEWDGKALKHLEGPIGAPRGYSIVEDLKQSGYQVQESDDARKDLRRVAQGWLGAVAALEAAEDYILESSPELNSAVIKLQPPISRKHYFLMLSHQFVRKYPDLAQKLWDKSREMRDKELPRILRKYIGN
jgi:polar amino acid transport system substrate-binding protein